VSFKLLFDAIYSTLISIKQFSSRALSQTSCLLCKGLLRCLTLAGRIPLVMRIVERMAPFSFLLALNFFRQMTVSCRCADPATRSTWQIQGCLSASSAVILSFGSVVSICCIKLLTSGVTVSHSGDLKLYLPVWRRN